MIDVRAPRLLDKNLAEKERLYAKSQSVSLNLTPLTTGSLALMERSSARVRDFIELYTARGTAGIYRVTSKESGYGTGGDLISLEHGICVLGDAVTPEEGTLSGTYRAVLTELLKHQTAKVGGTAMWTLGEVDVPETETTDYDMSGGKTLHAILDVLGTLDGYALTFDQSVFPWVMHVKKMEDTPSCEGRLSRNVITARVMIDDSDLCTRVESERLPGGYMQLEDEPEWGVVSARMSFADDVPDETVVAECRKYLEARKNPRISVEIDGLELSRITGEPLDRFDCGRMMRLALPEYGVTVNERIVSIHYAQAIERPERVTVTLSTALKDASSSLSGLSSSVDSLKSTSTSYGNRISSSEKSITNLKDTAEGIEEINGKMTRWFNSVEIDLNAEEAQLGALASRQEVTANEVKINEAVLILDGDTDVGGSRVGLVSRVTQNEADIDANELKITSVSEAVVMLETTTDEAFAKVSARVDENEASLSLHADELGSLATLKADKVYVDAEITEVRNLVAEEIEAAIADLNLSISETIVTNYLTVTGRATLEALAIDGQNGSWKETEYVKSIGRTKRYALSPSNVTIEFYEISSISNGTLYYFGY